MNIKIFDNIMETVGNTPLVKINRLSSGNIFAKLEYFNPSGSSKDRAVKNIVEEAEKSGNLKKGSNIIEPTSGNTGISLAFIAKVKGYNAILTMPESMSIERVNLMKYYGAEIILTDANKGMQGAIDKSEEIFKSKKNSFMLRQFENGANSEAHYKTTAPEIWKATAEKIDYFVAGVGTGGTISGCAKFFKRKNPDIKIVAIEPAQSPMLSKNRAGRHKIQGIGAGFIPKILDISLIDQIITVEDDEAIDMVKKIVLKEGFFPGISSGAAMVGALKIAKNNPTKNVVVLLPDSGNRYISIL